MFSTRRKGDLFPPLPPQPCNGPCFVPVDKRVAGILESFFPFPVSQQFLFSFPVLVLLKGSRSL